MAGRSGGMSAEASGEGPGKESERSAERSKISRRQALKITAVAGVGLALGGPFALDLLRSAELRRIRRTRTQLGTQVTITVVHPDAGKARSIVEATFAEIERLEAILSRYRPGTPVSLLGRDGIVRDPPPELVAVLRRARDLSDRTGGAFDVTVAPLLDLYRSRAEEGGGLPTKEEIESALALVDYRRLRVEDRIVELDRPDMALTLDGIAKGYVVDEAVATLTAAGAGRVLVEAGGDLATAGGDLGTPGQGFRSGWDVAVRDPHDPRRSLDVLRLRGEGVATSGDYVHAFTRDRSHHHIIDPRTGRSPDHTSAVTVVAPTALDADALSTAVFVLGPDAGLELLEGSEGVEGLVVGKDGSRLETTGYGRRA